MLNIFIPMKTKPYLLVGENNNTSIIKIGVPVYGSNKGIFSARLGFGFYSKKELELIIKAMEIEEKRRIIK